MYRKSIFIFVLCMSVVTLLTSCTMNSKDVQLVYDAKAGVGEGAMWDYKNNRLLWTDISGKKFFVYYPETSDMFSYQLPQEIGTVVPMDSNMVVMALANGIFTFSFDTKELKAQVLPDIDTARVRFNDGACAPDGSLWLGTMDYNVTEPIASLYKVGPGFSISKKMDSVTVSNGISWSLDGSKMYYIDSPTYSVVQFDYDTVRADISHKTKIISTPKRWGTPDGSTLDEEGMLWIAHWGGGIVSRWNPETGTLLDTLVVPAPNVTSVAFGGKDKDLLFITTARNWMQPGDEDKYPLAGGLFVAKPGVRGIDACYFRP